MGNNINNYYNMQLILAVVSTYHLLLLSQLLLDHIRQINYQLVNNLSSNLIFRCYIIICLLPTIIKKHENTQITNEVYYKNSVVKNKNRRHKTQVIQATIRRSSALLQPTNPVISWHKNTYMILHKYSIMHITIDTHALEAAAP